MDVMNRTENNSMLDREADAVESFERACSSNENEEHGRR